MGRYFENEELKDLDIRTIVDKLKKMERDCIRMISNSDCGKNLKIKYQFYPIETF